jgi:carbamoyl-phosphate synthase large subunit
VTNILITGIGGDIAQGIATIIREAFPEWRALGMDIHQRHAGTLFVGKTFLAPAVSDPSYDEWLEALVEREGVDMVIPTPEAELVHLSRTRAGSVGGARLVMANARAVDIGSDKLRTADFLASIGVDGPWTVPAEAFDSDTVLPCIFKSRRGAGSKTVFVCRTADEVGFYRDRYPSAILQELLSPAEAEVTCAVFRSRQGRVAVVQLLRTLVGGFTGWAQVIDDDQVSRQCTRIAEALELRGSINVQLRLTPAGPRIFEINPRFSSTVLIRHRMGFKDAVWSLQDVRSEEVTIQQPPVGMIGVRIQGGAIVTGAEAGPSHGE